MTDMRINLYLNVTTGDMGVQNLDALLNNLKSHGAMYLQTGNCFQSTFGNPDFQIRASDSYVRDIGSHEALAGYYVADECAPHLRTQILTETNRLRQLDGDGMAYGTLLSGSRNHLWRDVLDLLGVDIYAARLKEPATGYDHGAVGRVAATTRQAVLNERPFMMVLQSFKTGGGGRWPTRQEMRNHALMAVTEGAQGILWWTLGSASGADVVGLSEACGTPEVWCAARTTYMNNLRAVVNEIATLESVLLAETKPTLLASLSSPDIRTMVKSVSGKTYVFAYNTVNAPRTATFDMSGAVAAASVYGEGRNLSVSSAGAFSDSFGPYQAHVYVVQ
jgi:hypothetical protein